jgi:hypothetical protein
VWGKISDGDLSWVPSRNSFAIQNQNALVEENVDEATKTVRQVSLDVSVVKDELKAFERRMAYIEDGIRKLTEL